MCCQCCKTRLYWYQKPKIDEFGCRALRDLAAQVEEMYMHGIDIQSQKTNEQLDEEFDAPMCNWDTFIDINNTDNNINSSSSQNYTLTAAQEK